MSITLADHVTKALLPTFATALSLLTNLKMLRVFVPIDSNFQHTPIIEESFNTIALPSVEILSLPVTFAPFLSCCPLIRTVYCNSMSGRRSDRLPRQFIEAAATHCLILESLRFLWPLVDQNLFSRTSYWNFIVFYLFMQLLVITTRLPKLCELGMFLIRSKMTFMVRNNLN